MEFRKRYLNKIVAIALLGLILAVFMMLTDPQTVALPMLVVPFGLIGAMLYIGIKLLMSRAGNTNQRLRRMLALSIASFCVLLLILQSLDQLTWKDSLITLSLAVMFWVYVWRADFLRN